MAEPTAPVALRLVNDVETIKVLADPLRVAILRVLMRDARVRPPVLSVKELAEHLDEPVTKLYRHVRQLEAAGLIAVAETRLVSGIQESRYRTGQLDIQFDDTLLTSQTASGDTGALFTAGIREFIAELTAQLAGGRVSFTGARPGREHERPIFAMPMVRLSRTRALELRGHLVDLMNELIATADDPDGVDVRLLFGYLVDPGNPAPPETHRTSGA